jgi:hypothetical protein
MGRRKLRKQIETNQKANERQFTSMQAEQQPFSTAPSERMPAPSVYLDTRQNAALGLTPMPPGQRQPHREMAITEQPMSEMGGMAGVAGVQSEEHVERSAWHNVVTKNGRPIEGQQYGRGFEMARKEVVPDRPADRMAAGTAAVGATLHATPSQQYSQPSYPTAPPNGMTTPVLPPGMPTHIDPQHQLATQNKKKSDSPIPGPVFWIMLLVIMAAFFAAALI